MRPNPTEPWVGVASIRDAANRCDPTRPKSGSQSHRSVPASGSRTADEPARRPPTFQSLFLLPGFQTGWGLALATLFALLAHVKGVHSALCHSSTPFFSTYTSPITRIAVKTAASQISIETSGESA